MNDATLSTAYDAVCKERDQLAGRVKDLEEIVGLQAEAHAETRLENAQMRARLRLVELMEAEAANRLGFQIGMRFADDHHSLKVAQ